MHIKTLSNTHRLPTPNNNHQQGKTIDESYKPSSTDFLSDSDDEDLDKIDTQLHFGGGKFDSLNAAEGGAYGPSGGTNDLGAAYRSRREELEDRIKRKKLEKAERMKRKEDQGQFCHVVASVCLVLCMC